MSWVEANEGLLPVQCPVYADDDQLLGVNVALQKFAVLDPRKVELVTLGYFVGMSFDEASIALSIAVSAAKQWWAYARGWLSVELRDGAS